MLSNETLIKHSLLLVLAWLSLGAAAYAAPGDLDRSFSGDGKLTIDFEGFPAERAQAVTLRPSDGAILVAGTTHPSGESDDFAYAVVSPTGSGTPAEVTHDFGGDTDQLANGIIVTPAGFLLAGWSEGDFGLARFNDLNQPDPGFGGDGSVTVDFGTPAIGLDVAMDSSNRIVVAGITSAGGGLDDFAVARVRATDGFPDDTFSQDGKEVTDFGGVEQGHAVEIQQDGKIVVAGFAGPVGDNDFALARYRPADGSLDPAFSQDGKQTTDFSGSDHGYAMALQPDGKILVAGETHLSDFALARYGTDGTLDPSFSGDGKQTTDFAGDVDIGEAIAVQSDGKIVVAGSSFTGQATTTDFALARYNPNGTLDTGFSGDGKQTAAIAAGTGGDIATALLIQPDGKIVLAGYTEFSGGGDFAVARFEGGDGSGPPPDADGDGVPDASDDCPDVAAATPNGCPAPNPLPPPPDPPDLLPPPPGLDLSGDNVLTGGPQADLLCGEAGDDRIDGKGGADKLFGDFCPGVTLAAWIGAAQTGTDGNDVIEGGSGNDRLVGGGGNDKLIGGPGKDKLSGGAGKDTLAGGPGRNTYSGGGGNDKLNAANGTKETVNCGAGKRDSARVDRTDRLKGCERVRRPATRR